MDPTDARRTDTLQLVIREEAADDAVAIDQVNLAAFAGHPYSRQTEHLIVRALRAAGALELSLVATVDGDVVGHLAISPVHVGGVEIGWLGLGPLSVMPTRQRSGVGSALVRSGLRRLGERGARGCVVLGDPGYYGRFGFMPLPGLVCAGVPADHFMARVLSGTAPVGAVRYHAAFDVQP
jgi:putative acetyltransferase